jgi:hypothetical protein
MAEAKQTQQTSETKRDRADGDKVAAAVKKRPSRGNFLVVRPDGTHDYVTIPGARAILRSLQNCVGGDIEILPCDEAKTGHMWAYANEDGFNLGLPVNTVGTALLKLAHFRITTEVVGPIIVIGEDDRPLGAAREKLLEKLLDDIEAE